MLFGGLCLAALALAPPVAPEGGVVLLGAADLSHTHDGQRYLFQRISFGLARGSKSALVGTNGAGKSSLLRVLGGMEKAESGSVEIGARTRLAYVEQEPFIISASIKDNCILLGKRRNEELLQKALTAS